jgi:3-phytase
MTRNFFLIAIFMPLALACTLNQPAGDDPDQAGFVEISADLETTPVPDVDDAADDPAIWVNPSDPSKSTIIGTNKQRGLEVYNLNGELLYRYDWGRINNVDLRYGFPVGDTTIDIVGGSNRTDNSILVAGIDPATGELELLITEPILTGLQEVYGFCLYHEKESDRYFAIINGKDGSIEQWLLGWDPEKKVTAELVRSLSVDSQPEGCVADDELGFLYVGEEMAGIWKFNARPEEDGRKILVDHLDSNNMLKDDIEGLTIFYADSTKGYLIASSQGNNSYAVYEREGDNNFLGSFRLVHGDSIDGTYDTDGIDVTGAYLGESFPSGIFIAQDGTNEESEGTANQNFKVVSWEKIAKALELP